MAVDIWLPSGLKIANVRRASPKKKLSKQLISWASSVGIIEDLFDLIVGELKE